MNKKVVGIIVAIIAIIAVVALCISLGGKKEEPTNNPIVVVTESGEKEVVETKVVEKDPYKANIPNEILDFYLEKVDELEKRHKEEQAKLIEDDPNTDLTSLTKLTYDLVFFDDNNTPELVVSKLGYTTSLYTYDAGKVIYAMRDEGEEVGDEYGWPYGAAGNSGYVFVPRENVLKNENSDYAGLVRYYAFYELDENTHNLKNKFDGVLRENHFEDKNGNGEVDEDERDNYVEKVTGYYVGDKKLTPEEARNYVVESNEFEELVGNKTADEFRKALSSMVNEK